MSDSLSLTSQLQWIRWLLGHAQQLPSLLTAFEQFQAAADVRGKWTAAKSAGDIVVGFFDDFPGAAPQRVPTEEEFHAQAADLATAAGFDLARLQKLLAFVEQFLPLLLKLFGAGQSSPQA